MKTLKKCPFRKEYISSDIYNYGSSGTPLARRVSENFQNCLGKECAAWVNNSCGLCRKESPFDK